MNAPQVKEIPGMTFTGEFNRFHGQSLPVYAPKEPTNGRPSINTLEGWNLLRHELAERDLLRALHRQPTETEITAELARNEALAAATAERANSTRTPKLLRTVYNIHGFMVEVTRGTGHGLCMPYDTDPSGRTIGLVLGRNMSERQGLEFAKWCIETGKFGFFPDQKTI
ncbi:hypothetical protein [Gemmiger sp. An194]|uniref:hypothetical protein n=1 Tax=Gemmiger sp. An194 TaxID=1965582 RepID=UPI000B381DDE|nr:hypothetical protein [Gemmiger sp. An194]OUP23759.1 hypothetical protein B5F28_09650 [Gemmiger sp. An194]